MAARHPNQIKMEAAVARWIGEAQARPDRAELLGRRAEWVAAQIAILGRNDLTIPAQLEGLTVWDLQAAQHDLERAARGQPPLVREPMVQIVFGYHHGGVIIYFGSRDARPGVHPPYGTLAASVADGHRFVDDRGRLMLLQMAAADPLVSEVEAAIAPLARSSTAAAQRILQGAL